MHEALEPSLAESMKLPTKLTKVGCMFERLVLPETKHALRIQRSRAIRNPQTHREKRNWWREAQEQGLDTTIFKSLILLEPRRTFENQRDRESVSSIKHLLRKTYA